MIHSSFCCFIDVDSNILIYCPHGILLDTVSWGSLRISDLCRTFTQTANYRYDYREKPIITSMLITDLNKLEII